MTRTRKPKYCRAIIVYHGKSELILFSRLKSVLRLPINVVGSGNGRSSVKIQGIERYFNRDEFNDKGEFCKKFFQEDYRNLHKNRKFQSLLNQLKIFVIMDIDDATSDQVTGPLSIK